MSSLFLLLNCFANPPFRGPMLAAAAGMAVSLAFDVRGDLQLFCGPAAAVSSLADVADRLPLLIAINSPLGVTLAWLAMLVAMMSPLIALPFAHVLDSSLVERRWRAGAGFVAGYFGCWLLAGIPLFCAALLLRLVAGSAEAALTAAIVLALLWCASPLQQVAQNRAHRLQRIGLFGLAADRDCIAFGMVVGFWCAASCWVWMLVPFLVTWGHSAAMLAVSAIVLAQRLRGPGEARWRLPEPLPLPIGWLRHAGMSLWRRGERGYV